MARRRKGGVQGCRWRRDGMLGQEGGLRGSECVGVGKRGSKQGLMDTDSEEEGEVGWEGRQEGADSGRMAHEAKKGVQGPECVKEGGREGVQAGSEGADEGMVGWEGHQEGADGSGMVCCARKGVQDPVHVEREGGGPRRDWGPIAQGEGGTSMV
jgi:hypothetical protein